MVLRAKRKASEMKNPNSVDAGSFAASNKRIRTEDNDNAAPSGSASQSTGADCYDHLITQNENFICPPSHENSYTNLDLYAVTAIVLGIVHQILSNDGVDFFGDGSSF